MNNFNIHVEIRNPKKQALDTKLETRASYLTNWRIEEQGTDHGEPPGRQLGLGLALRGECGTVGEGWRLWWRYCGDVGTRGCSGGAAGGAGTEHGNARARRG